MISEKEALEIHTILIERFGGSNGIRDKGLLDSALNRPLIKRLTDKNYIHPQLIKRQQFLKA